MMLQENETIDCIFADRYLTSKNANSIPVKCHEENDHWINSMLALTKFLILFIILGLQTVLADYEITNPVAGTVWHKGKPAIIKWRVLGKPDVTTTTIELRKGDPKDLDHTTIIGNSVKANAGSHSWVVKNNIPTGKDYVVQIGESPHNVRYSHMFAIEN
ncbi:hypothetical protein G9A89_009765 [Geosiphon pyriformis]|nr:hypothetical protein G9A89_009765 [Geosiphon pyriformis]